MIVPTAVVQLVRQIELGGPVENRGGDGNPRIVGFPEPEYGILGNSYNCPDSDAGSPRIRWISAWPGCTRP